MRLTKYNPETGQYEYKEPAKTQEEFIAQRKAVIQRLGEYEDRAEWISVEERLPEPNTCVLIYVFFHNQWQIVKGWLSYCDKKFHISNSDYPSLTDVLVTHWISLPEPPKMKGADDEQRKAD